MPKKKQKETPSEQAARFRKEAQKLIDDGELNPTDAERALDMIVKQARVEKGEDCD